MARLTKEAAEAEIAGLPDLSLATMRERWSELYGNPAPRSLRRDLLARAIAYQLQVKAFGMTGQISTRTAVSGPRHR